jgi:hypothetical protein
VPAGDCPGAPARNAPDLSPHSPGPPDNAGRGPRVVKARADRDRPSPEPPARHTAARHAPPSRRCSEPPAMRAPARCSRPDPRRPPSEQHSTRARGPNERQPRQAPRPANRDAPTWHGPAARQTYEAPPRTAHARPHDRPAPGHPGRAAAPQRASAQRARSPRSTRRCRSSPP